MASILCKLKCVVRLLCCSNYTYVISSPILMYNLPTGSDTFAIQILRQDLSTCKSFFNLDNIKYLYDLYSNLTSDVIFFRFYCPYINCYNITFISSVSPKIISIVLIRKKKRENIINFKYYCFTPDKEKDYIPDYANGNIDFRTFYSKYKNLVISQDLDPNLKKMEKYNELDISKFHKCGCRFC